VRGSPPFSAALISLAFLVLGTASLVTMGVSIQHLRTQRQERLQADAEVLATSLRDLDPYFVDPEDCTRAQLILRRLAGALELREASVVGLGDKVLLSTSPEILPGFLEPTLLAFPLQTRAAWEGEFRLTQVFREQEHPFQAALLPLRDEEGQVAALLVVTVGREDFEHLDFLRSSFRLVVLVASALVILLLGFSWSIHKRAEAAEATLEHGRRLSLAGQVAASVVHEVRNPLGIIRSTLEFLRDSRSLEGEDREFAEEALEEADRIGETLERFLSLAREAPPEPREVALGEALKAVVRLIHKDLERRGIVLTLQIETELHCICDDLGLRQALLNLLLNARNSLEAQEGDNPSIRLSLKAAPSPSSGALIQVEDNGPGFPSEVLREPFRAFRTSRPDGTGLGLPLIERFATGTGGKVQLENPPQGGARVCLWLPTLTPRRNHG
jgi:signal transduction histidine kinase